MAASGLWTTLALAGLYQVSQPFLRIPFQRIHLNRGLLFKGRYPSSNCLPQDAYAFYVAIYFQNLKVISVDFISAEWNAIIIQKMRWLGASRFHACQALRSAWGKLFTCKRGGGSGSGSRQRLREWSRSNSLPRGPHAPRKAEATDHLQSKAPTLSKTFLGERGLCTRPPWGAGEAHCLAPTLLLGVTEELC